MHSSRPPRGGSSPAALPALLRASHLFGLALGSALGKLRDSGVTAARMFERAEESALLLRMTREAAGILAARWDKVPERQRPHYPPEQRFRILGIRSARPSLCDPASSWQAGRRSQGLAVSNRVSRCGAAAASSGSKSSLTGGHPVGESRSKCAGTEPSW